MQKSILIIFILFAILVSGYYFFANTPNPGAGPERFIVPRDRGADVSALLKEQGFVRSAWITKLFLSVKSGDTTPGGYKLSKGMNAWEIAGVLTQAPYMRWVTIPEGLRKEETAEVLGASLMWQEAQSNDFLNAYKTIGAQYREGYYFPETYLIPTDEDGAVVAKRMIDKFNENFSPYYAMFLKENIKEGTAIKIASLIEREAAGHNDMPLVAGIIWNRLLQNMKLDIDATLQYAQGKVGDLWWAPIHGPDARKLESPYNTYLHKGLPPTAISNPGSAAIEAALHPAKTDCLYYLHDKTGQIHCTKTYPEHQRNIQLYL
ncbi:MAG: endolytic transglycosylase MltG [Patescibacteria group bacterium]